MPYCVLKYHTKYSHTNHIFEKQIISNVPDAYMHRDPSFVFKKYGNIIFVHIYGLHRHGHRQRQIGVSAHKLYQVLREINWYPYSSWNSYTKLRSHEFSTWFNRYLIWKKSPVFQISPNAKTIRKCTLSVFCLNIFTGKLNILLW